MLLFFNAKHGKMLLAAGFYVYRATNKLTRHLSHLRLCVLGLCRRRELFFFCCCHSSGAHDNPHLQFKFFAPLELWSIIKKCYLFKCLSLHICTLGWRSEEHLHVYAE
jgi:hypothetical protein